MRLLSGRNRTSKSQPDITCHRCSVPLVISGNPIAHHRTGGQQVETTQIAPTILTLLGLNPSYLQAVQIEHTNTQRPLTRAPDWFMTRYSAELAGSPVPGEVDAAPVPSAFGP